MPDYNYILFDTLPSTAVVLDTLLFQVAQGADATHTEAFTNMRGAGSLPATEKFAVEYICLMMPPNVAPADAAALFISSFLQFRLLNKIIVWAPLQALISYSAWNSFFTLAAAATLNFSGFIGEPFRLKTPIVIDGGVKFDVRVKTTTATAVAVTAIVGLVGALTMA